MGEDPLDCGTCADVLRWYARRVPRDLIIEGTVYGTASTLAAHLRRHDQLRLAEYVDPTPPLPPLPGQETLL